MAERPSPRRRNRFATASDETTPALGTATPSVSAAGMSAAGAGMSAAGASMSVIEAGMSAIGADVSAAGADVSAAGANVSAIEAGMSAIGVNVSAAGDDMSAAGAGVSAAGADLSAIGADDQSLDAAPLQRQHLRVLRVGEHATEQLELLPQLLELRELHVKVPPSPERARSLLEALVAASRHWPKLETLLVQLTVMSDLLRPNIPRLPIQLRENCSRLTDVTLVGNFADMQLECMAKTLPAVRMFRVDDPFLSSNGSFLSLLPAELRHLSVGCYDLHSEAVKELRRYGELRTLKLRCGNAGSVQPAHLAAGLSGCGRLRGLTVDPSALSSECRLHLPELRHLDFSHPQLTDADLHQLLSQLPGLESFSLKYCRRLTPEGLMRGLWKLTKLQSLSSLELKGIAIVCDRALAELRSQSLQQLYLSDHESLVRPQYECALTAKGLLEVVNNCGSLEALILRVGAREERIDCDLGAREQGLFEKIQAAIDWQRQTPQPRDTQDQRALKRRKSAYY